MTPGCLALVIGGLAFEWKSIEESDRYFDKSLKSYGDEFFQSCFSIGASMATPFASNFACIVIFFNIIKFKIFLIILTRIFLAVLNDLVICKFSLFFPVKV